MRKKNPKKNKKTRNHFDYDLKKKRLLAFIFASFHYRSHFIFVFSSSSYSCYWLLYLNGYDFNMGFSRIFFSSFFYFQILFVLLSFIVTIQSISHFCICNAIVIRFSIFFIFLLQFFCYYRNDFIFLFFSFNLIFLFFCFVLFLFRLLSILPIYYCFRVFLFSLF